MKFYRILILLINEMHYRLDGIVVTLAFIFSLMM